MEDKRLRSRIKVWACLSFFLLIISISFIYWGGPILEFDGRRLPLGQLTWLPGLIGACSCLWLLLTLGRARANVSIPLSLANLAAAEALILLLPVEEVSGLDWGTGNGLVPAISFAALALTSITWTATGLIDPLRTNRMMYAVALAAVLVIGFLLSYEYLWSLQGALASALAAALLWGMSYDQRLRPYKGGKLERTVSPWALALMTFLGLPLLLLGLPYLLH